MIYFIYEISLTPVLIVFMTDCKVSEYCTKGNYCVSKKGFAEDEEAMKCWKINCMHYIFSGG